MNSDIRFIDSVKHFLTPITIHPQQPSTLDWKEFFLNSPFFGNFLTLPIESNHLQKTDIPRTYIPLSASHPSMMKRNLAYTILKITLIAGCAFYAQTPTGQIALSASIATLLLTQITLRSTMTPTEDTPEAPPDASSPSAADAAATAAKSSPPPDQANLSRLPFDLLEIIFANLELKDLGNVSCTCRRLNEATDPDRVWDRWLTPELKRVADRVKPLIQSEAPNTEITQKKLMKALFRDRPILGNKYYYEMGDGPMNHFFTGLVRSKGRDRTIEYLMNQYGCQRNRDQWEYGEWIFHQLEPGSILEYFRRWEEKTLFKEEIGTLCLGRLAITHTKNNPRDFDKVEFTRKAINHPWMPCNSFAVFSPDSDTSLIFLKDKDGLVDYGQILYSFLPPPLTVDKYITYYIRANFSEFIFFHVKESNSEFPAHIQRVQATLDFLRQPII
jgi:hypothetical protein